MAAAIAAAALLAVHPAYATATWPTYACVMSAAKAFHVNPWIIVGLMKTENGRPGQIVHDANGSYDMGPMQINSFWLPKLHRLGITPHKLASNGCLNIEVGTAIYARQLKAAHGDTAKAIGWYHSHIRQYAIRYRERFDQIMEELSKRARR